MNCEPDTGCCKYSVWFCFQRSELCCLSQSICLDAIKQYPTIKVSEFGAASGDDEIMAEIFARGPVSAYINAECIETYTGGINMYDTCNTRTTNHAIQLNGWGTENGVDFWIGRNSWGTYWGEKGFFRIVRGGAYKPGKGYWAVPEI